MFLTLLFISLPSAGSDYTTISQQVTFLGAGSTRAAVRVPILDDSSIENNEIFTGVLSSSEPNVAIGDETATVTILDDDGGLFLTCRDP